MRLSQTVWKTYKEAPSEAEIPSHQLMLRAGLIHKASAGIYNFLPMGQRTIHKIETIVREELDRIDSQEISMSVVTPGELWKKSGRWESMTEMLKFKDKKKGDLCISPTNEEAVVDIFLSIVQSYKDLPVSLYQINTKFRDEIRPRFGLMRGREFIMKDAYTFHRDKACLDTGYQKFYQAYEQILKRMGLDYIVVEADAGMMADSDQQTHEFQVIADVGEDTVVFSKSYCANIERAQTQRADTSPDRKKGDLKSIATPSMTSIKQVCDFLNIKEFHALKSLLYKAVTKETEEVILLLLLGDDSLNETKLKSHLKCGQAHALLATKRSSHWGFVKGFIGPCQTACKNTGYP